MMFFSFIGSGSAEFKPEIEAIIDILNGFGFPHSFALLNEREKGLDVTCDKICSKIKEAQFCIVLLNDPLSKSFDNVRVPSANVYYEFGLAVAQKKGVIPIFKRGFTLPFDIQHLDAIVYDDIDNFKESLKKAIVARLRKQTKGVQQNYDAQIQKEIYGPLYNEIDRLASRTYKFDILTNGNYLDILETYKYLFDKTDSYLPEDR